VAQRVPGDLGSQNPWYSAREVGEGYNVDVNVKIYPLTGYKGTEEGQRYNSILSFVLALDGVCGQPHAPVLFLRNELVLIWKWGVWWDYKAGLETCEITVMHREFMLGHSIA
jgi:hypothetical protein